MARFRIGEILVRAGVLTEERLREVLSDQRRAAAPQPIGRLLVSSGLVTETMLVAALGAQLEVPTIDLDTFELDRELLEKFDRTYAEEHGVLPLRLVEGTLGLAMTDPSWAAIIDDVQGTHKVRVQPHLTGPGRLARAIERGYGVGSGTGAAPTPDQSPGERAQVRELRRKLEQQERLVASLRQLCAEEGVMVPDDL